MSQAKPTITESDRVLFSGDATSGFDIDKLIYFGASIFWRGAAHRWPAIGGDEIPIVQLGPHQEQMRLFLLGQRGFPDEISLTVMLFPYEKVPVGFFLPDSSPVPGWERYWFYIDGLGFVLDFGKGVPSDIRNRSTSYSSGRLITISNQFGDLIWKLAKQMAGDLSGLESMLKEIAAIRSRNPSGS